MRLVLTCPEEIKDLVFEEAKKFSTPLKMLHKAVLVEVTEEEFYKAHLECRLASQIFLTVQKVTAHTLKMLTKRCEDLPWLDYMTSKHTFKVTAIQATRAKNSTTSNDISRSVRAGVEAYFEKQKMNLPKVELKEPDLEIVALLYDSECDISIRTGGMALHKRGYSASKHPAPLKETLAAAALSFAEWKGETAFMDVMCGSGTLAIEAASMALGKAPLIHRKKGSFSFERHEYFNSAMFRKVSEGLRNRKLLEIDVPIQASDIEEKYVTGAREDALRARVEKYIQWNVGDALKSKPIAEKGLIVANLPYGERLQGKDAEDLKDLYRLFGQHLKYNFPGWRALVLCAETSPHKELGMRPNKKKKVLNGSIETKLLVYDIYSGSRKTPND